nr:uncharacterized protein LOC111379512 [Ipomoea trifida]
MESKMHFPERQMKSNMQKLYSYALLGMLAYFTVRLCVPSHPWKIEQIMKNQLRDAFVTSAVKFLNFFIAKLVVFRYAAPLQPMLSVMSWLFWIVFTLSISTLYS